MASHSDSSAGYGWSTTAPTYAASVGKSSAIFASRLTSLANKLRPLTSSSYVLDNGAGTGAMTLAIASDFPGTRILATDISGSMLSNIDSQNLPNVTTRVVDAREVLKEFGEAQFSHVFCTFMLQTITTPTEALREMHAVLRPDGVVGIGIWAAKLDVYEIWDKSCKAVDPEYVLPPLLDDEAAWRTQEELEGKLREVGFKEISSEEVRMPFEFENSSAYMKFWFESKNPGTAKAIASWKGDMDEVKREMETVLRNEYGNGKEISLGGVLGLGIK